MSRQNTKNGFIPVVFTLFNLFGFVWPTYYCGKFMWSSEQKKAPGGLFNL